MMEYSSDVAIIGAGFGGSLTALLLSRIGMKPILIERGSHPRFAIGESSTPLADLVLAELADRYNLPRLKPLTEYGSWKRTYPELTCGLKRGFSYFHHLAGEPFRPREDHANELLVAASKDDEHSDTHWLRADFDAFLVGEACSAGILYLDRTELTRIEPGEVWRMRGRRGDEIINIAAPFVIDASGQAGVLASVLGIKQGLSTVRTNTRTLYSHFTGVHSWADLYEASGGSLADHPFPCQSAALHHVFDGGWMYVLPFDNGVTSAGFSLDNRRAPLDESVSPEAEWNGLLKKFPSIERQFERAVAIRPFTRTSRMQRRVSRMVGPNWAMLPYAACFLDPLHSSGNAHSLFGIARLIAAFEAPREERAEMFREYERTVFQEVALFDKIIHGCHIGFARFELMTAFSMFYFAAAHHGECARREGRASVRDAFLNAHDETLGSAVDGAYRELCKLASQDDCPRSALEAFERRVADAIRPYNSAGLCDPSKQNMYECV